MGGFLVGWMVVIVAGVWIEIWMARLLAMAAAVIWHPQVALVLVCLMNMSIGVVV